MHPSPRLETSRKKRRIQSEDQRAVKGWARQKAKNNIAVLSCTWYGRRALGWLRMTRGYDRLWQGTDRQAKQGIFFNIAKSLEKHTLNWNKAALKSHLDYPKIKPKSEAAFPSCICLLSNWHQWWANNAWSSIWWIGPPMITTRSRLARRILPLIRTAVPQSHQELYDRISGQVRTAVKGGVVDKPCNGHDITSRTARHHSGNFGLCKRLQV